MAEAAATKGGKLRWGRPRHSDLKAALGKVAFELEGRL